MAAIITSVGSNIGASRVDSKRNGRNQRLDPGQSNDFAAWREIPNSWRAGIKLAYQCFAKLGGAACARSKSAIAFLCFADKDFKRIRTLRRFSKTTLPSWRYRMRSSLRLWRYDAFAFGSKGATFEALSGTPIASTPNNSATRFRRLATSPEMAALADSTSRIAVNAAWRSLSLSGNSFGIAASARS